MQLRHAPLATEMEKPSGKLRSSKKQTVLEGEDNMDDEGSLPKSLSSKITKQASDQRLEVYNEKKNDINNNFFAIEYGSEEGEDNDGSDDGYDDRLMEKNGDYIDSVELTNDEDSVIQKFLATDKLESRSLADIIMAKLREKDESDDVIDQSGYLDEIQIPSKVIEVYTAVGKMLQHYKSGKLPKALKMLPHLKNWEHILWLTRPDEWSPSATYAATRVFASNLNAKMAQRFFNLVLLEKCRDDIRVNSKMNYHLYLALKKALFKPAAFYKGLLLPLAQSGTCTLREALIIGSVLAKVSIPGNHSAAVIMRLAEMPYSGSTSIFVKILLNKKYALPRRVIEALVCHFCSFAEETRILPVIFLF